MIQCWSMKRSLWPYFLQLDRLMEACRFEVVPVILILSHFKVDRKKEAAACVLDRQSYSTKQWQLLPTCSPLTPLMHDCHEGRVAMVHASPLYLSLSKTVIASLRMSVSDFRHQFELMEVCYLTDSLRDPGPGVQPWGYTMHHGNWVPNVTAGGSHAGGKANDNINRNKYK